MISDRGKRMLPVWLPAVVLCLAAAVVFVWQTSESGGRRAQVRDRVVDLEAELARLEGLMRATGGDREWVAETEQQFTTLHDEVFGTLDGRLTNILRAVGAATRDAGLLPGSYSYAAKEDRDTGFVRFSIQFSVEGEYGQIRQMLADLQSSPEFLLVEGLSLSGDEDPDIAGASNLGAYRHLPRRGRPATAASAHRRKHRHSGGRRWLTPNPRTSAPVSWCSSPCW